MTEGTPEPRVFGGETRPPVDVPVPFDDGIQDLDGLLVRLAPDLAPRLGVEERFGPYAVGLVLGLVSLGAAAEALGPSMSAGTQILFLALAVAVMLAVGEGASRLSHRADVARHRAWLRDRPEEVQGRLADLLRSRIERRREELLGTDSEWARARRPVEAAVHEAGASLAYWRERATQDPDDPAVSAHLATAQALTDKLDRAMASLDRRSGALRAFLDRCDAKLAVLERGRRDLEEGRRLAGLARRADLTIGRADSSLEGIALRFVQDAREVAAALAGLDRVRLLDRAAEGPVEDVEDVADRILDSEAEAERALVALSRGLDGGGIPAP